MFPVNNCTIKSRLSPLKGLRQYQRLRSASKARSDSALQASTNITADTRTANLMASVSCFRSLVHGASGVCERLPRICLKQQRKPDSCILFCSESKRNARGLPPLLGGIYRCVLQEAGKHCHGLNTAVCDHPSIEMVNISGNAPFHELKRYASISKQSVWEGSFVNKLRFYMIFKNRTWKRNKQSCLGEALADMKHEWLLVAPLQVTARQGQAQRMESGHQGVAVFLEKSDGWN